MTEKTLAERRGLAGMVGDDAIRLIDLALAEDLGPGDWTTRWTIPARMRASAEIVSRAAGIVAGTAVVGAVFARIDPRVECSIARGDGTSVEPGDVICTLRGPARALLTGERVALNFLQRLSGVATLTHRFVEATAGGHTRVFDTRKTTPAWRALEKAAVRAGGGHNHRHGLYDMVLIKNNHIAIAGGITEAITRVKEQNTRRLAVQVEVRTMLELDEALDAGVQSILLDNMDLDTLRRAVRRARRRKGSITLEASGNVSLATVRDIAGTGVDRISIGAITHSAPVLDVSLRILPP